uniref:Amino acid transporter transmembrane domain-containing protein n=1 Tax=Oryza nivara TaxID=4536 RepID=A0A0E0J7Q8_ORYNI
MVQIEPLEVSLEAGNQADSALLDDDGRPRRTGTFWTASAHIITAVIGSGVLSLPWATAQLGWVGGPAVMVVFGGVTYFTATLQAECYRTGDEETGARNYTYIGAVRAILGGANAKLCGIIQYANLVGTAIGYTIAASISMQAIKRAGCFHANGHNVPCHISSTPYMLIFGAFEIVFSQIPDFHEIWWLSIVAAVMSFTYSGVGLGLGIAQTVADGGFRGTITGVTNVTATQKAWRSLQALGNIAFAFAFSNVYTEIQDTIKAPPPSEAKVMKQASLLSIVATSVFYALCGWMGYAAFGNAAPDNLLTGFGFFEPFWLVDAANVAIAVHLIGAYQVYCQPVFAFVERKASRRWPDSGFVNSELRVGPFAISAFRLAWRSVFVCFTTVVAMALPFFGVIVGLLGAISFWPLTVYLPTEMYIAQRGVRRGSALWIGLRALAVAGFVVSAAATTGAVANFVGDFMKFRPFSG